MAVIPSGLNMEYTSIENIQRKLGRNLTEQESAYFEYVLSDAITGFINRITETRFGYETAGSVYASGDGTPEMVIPTCHTITAVHKVDNDGTETAVASDEFITYPREAYDKYSLRKKTGDWTEGVENYKITCVLGHQEIPAEITLVATEMAVNALTEPNNNYKSEKVGDWAVTYADTEKTLSVESKRILESYRRLSRRV